MNTKLSILLTAIAGSVISAMPAQAFSFGTSGISFDKDTTLEFEVLQTYGGYKSDLGIYEVVNGEIVGDFQYLFGEYKASDDASGPQGAPGDDPIGTAGNAVVGSPTQFTFKAGKTYTLALENYGSWQNKDNNPNPFWGTVYSTTTLNTDLEQRAVFGSIGGSEKGGFNASDYTEGDIFELPYLNISFDDAGNNNDKDYQDFTLQAMVVSTPEPATLAGLGIVAGGMFLSTLRKKQK